MVVIVYLWLLSSSTYAWLYFGGVLQSHAVMILSACIYTWLWNIAIMIININTIKLCNFLYMLNMVRMILLAIFMVEWTVKREKQNHMCNKNTLVVIRIILTVATSMIIMFVVIACIVATVSFVSVASWSSVSGVIADQEFTITHNHNIKTP